VRSRPLIANPASELLAQRPHRHLRQHPSILVIGDSFKDDSFVGLLAHIRDTSSIRLSSARNLMAIGQHSPS
jgi:hypothetical protein